MRNCLTCGGMDVDANVEAIGLKLFNEHRFEVVDHEPAGGLLFETQFKIIGAMSFGNDQRMAPADGKLVEEGKGGGRFQNECTFFPRVAERAIGRSVSGELVKVAVGVNFAVFIFKEGGVTQLHVALVSWFLMNLVGSETFKC